MSGELTPLETAIAEALDETSAVNIDLEDVRFIAARLTEKGLVRAALSGSTAPLDEAWREAEAALPEGGRLHLQRRAGQEAIQLDDGQTWIARQGRDESPYEAWATDRSQSLGFAYGNGPVEVLRKLAVHLRLAASPDPAQGGET